MKNKQNILVAEDHQFFIDGLTNHLNKFSDINIYTAKNGKQALEIIKNNKIDVLISDINMPEMNGIDLCENVKAKNPHIKIIIITEYADREHILPLLRIRVDAIINKIEAKEDILLAMEAIFNNKKYYSNRIEELRIAIIEGRRPKQESGIPSLTNREKELLPYITEGQTNKKIAEQFYLSHYTIEGHRKNLYLKFDVHNAAELCTKAFKFGLLD